jgi:hypothetical protein
MNSHTQIARFTDRFSQTSGTLSRSGDFPRRDGDEAAISLQATTVVVGKPTGPTGACGCCQFCAGSTVMTTR